MAYEKIPLNIDKNTCFLWSVSERRAMRKYTSHIPIGRNRFSLIKVSEKHISGNTDTNSNDNKIIL
jgi:hypothetical protein